MIPLSARGTATRIGTQPVLGRVARTPVSPDQRHRTIRVIEHVGAEDFDGYAAVVAANDVPDSLELPAVIGCSVAHLADGDVVSLNGRGEVRTVFRAGSTSNVLFATDRCNSLCLMCSQPPRDVDDSERVQELLQLIDFIPPTTEALGITGGEPTLLGEGLVEVLAACRDKLPSTHVHVLSNGRRLADRGYARTIGELHHPHLMVAIPIYSDINSRHDYVVQAEGAFDESISGIYNLAQAGVSIEIRVVIHRETYARLPRLAEFIYRNLTFAAHVTFMGMEIVGFARTNLSSLWMDPVDYQGELNAAVLYLASSGMNVSIYNHQLCTLPKSLRPFSRRAISDWKNDYAPPCLDCAAKGACGGFFTWNLNTKISRAIHPITDL